MEISQKIHTIWIDGIIMSCYDGCEVYLRRELKEVFLRSSCLTLSQKRIVLKIRSLSKVKVVALLNVTVTLIQLYFAEFPEIGWTETALHEGSNITLAQAASLAPTVADLLFPEVFVPHLGALRIAYHDLDCEKLLGEGGYARVYKATLFHAGVFMSVAVKELNLGATRSENIPRFQEFKVEAEYHSKLNHPNIVQLIGMYISTVPSTNRHQGSQLFQRPVSFWSCLNMRLKDYSSTTTTK